MNQYLKQHLWFVIWCVIVQWADLGEIIESWMGYSSWKQLTLCTRNTECVFIQPTASFSSSMADINTSGIISSSMNSSISLSTRSFAKAGCFSTCSRAMVWKSVQRHLWEQITHNALMSNRKKLHSEACQKTPFHVVWGSAIRSYINWTIWKPWEFNLIVQWSI